MVHVLTVRLLGSAPERVADDVHAGRQHHVVQRPHGLVAERHAYTIFEIHVPGRRSGRGGRERRGVVLAIALAVVLPGCQVHTAASITVPVAAHGLAIAQIHVLAALDFIPILVWNVWD